MSDQLDQYIQQWELSNPQEIATSPIGQIFKVEYQGRPAILKLLSEIGFKDEGAGAEALKYFDGVGAVRLYNWESHAVLMEFAEGENLKSYMSAKGDLAAAQEMVSVFNKLHEPRSIPPPQHFQNLRTRFRYLFKMAELAESSPLTKDAATILEDLLASEENQGILHGDLHHENVLQSKDRGWLAIDPKGLYGEITYDLANTFYNPNGASTDIFTKERILSLSKLYSEQTGLDSKRILMFAFAHGILSVSWMIEDGLQITGTFAVAKQIRELI